LHEVIVSASPERIVHLRDLFRRMWPEALGWTPSAASLQVALGICGVEGWGNWSGEMANSNNFGGLQVPISMQPGGDGVTYVGAPHIDHHYDGTEYTTYFKFFVDGGGHTAEENGAIAFLRTVALRRTMEGAQPPVIAPLRAGSAYDTAEAMHDTGYYEGFPPDPVQTYADGIVKHATTAATALGEPVMVVGGGGKKRFAVALGAGLLVAWTAGWLE
jgi:hypothetical protein